MGAADAADTRTDGRVEAIAVAPAAEAPMALVEQATAHAGRGLEGDRYVGGKGTFSNPYSRGHDLTLIEGEVVDDLGVAPELPRRNVVTRGIDLNALVGRRFRVGEVECEGARPVRAVRASPAVDRARTSCARSCTAGGLRARHVVAGGVHPRRRRRVGRRA